MGKRDPLILECPEIGKWWDERNDIGPDKITRGSHYEAYLTCPACHVHWRRDIHAFISIRRDGRILPGVCPECGYSSEGLPEDNVLKVCPSIVDWWDYEENAPFRPEQFTKGSKFMAHLICPDCGMNLCSGIRSLLHTDKNGDVIISHKGRCRKYRAMKSEVVHPATQSFPRNSGAAGTVGAGIGPGFGRVSARGTSCHCLERTSRTNNGVYE